MRPLAIPELHRRAVGLDMSASASHRTEGRLVRLMRCTLTVLALVMVIGVAGCDNGPPVVTPKSAAAHPLAPDPAVGTPSPGSPSPPAAGTSPPAAEPITVPNLTAPPRRPPDSPPSNPHAGCGLYGTACLPPSGRDRRLLVETSSLSAPVSG